VGRAQEAEVAAPQVGVPDAAERAGLDEAEQLHLQGQGDVAHLVEEEGAAVARLDEPGLALARPGKGALLEAEQLALEERLRDAAAVQRNEAAGRARAHLVNRLREPLLSRSRLAEEQDGRVGRRHPRRELQHAVEDRGTPHERRLSRPRGRDRDGAKNLDERTDRPGCVRHGVHDDLLVAGALRGMVHVENPALFARGPALGDRTGLARLVAGGGVTVRHLVAVASHDLAARSERLAIRASRRDDPVVRADDDGPIGQAVEHSIQRDRTRSARLVDVCHAPSRLGLPRLSRTSGGFCHH
jgi:hypothetical protein